MGTVLICGAGIAGLSAALQFKQAGYRVIVFEKEPELRTAGVGLNIWPNGVRFLKQIGLGERFLREAATMRRWLALDSDGTVTSDLDVGDWNERYGAPLTGARRRMLNAMLASGLDQHELRFSSNAVEYTQTDDSVTVRFDNGETASGELLVGADGVGSQLRKQMFHEQPRFLNESFVRWRGVFACADAGVELDAQADVLGDTGHFGWIPIGGGNAYWYGTVRDRSEFRDVYRLYSTWSRTPVCRIIDASEPCTVIGREVTHFADHLTTWLDGRTVLIGDAAHPMYPGMAQGANQAMEDAESLVRHLAKTSSVNAALASFEHERLPVANKMVEYSRKSFEFESAREGYASTGLNLQVERYKEFDPGNSAH